MAVDLGELIPALAVALNAPGDPAAMFDMDDDAWIDALAGGFWDAWLLGFYRDYRVSVEGDTVVNIVDDMIDLPRGDQQIIVRQTAINAIKAKFATLFTQSKDVAGPVSTERQRSASLLKALLDANIADLQAMRDNMLQTGSTSVAVIDAILVRTGYSPLVGAHGAPWVS